MVGIISPNHILRYYKSQLFLIKFFISRRVFVINLTLTLSHHAVKLVITQGEFQPY